MLGSRLGTAPSVSLFCPVQLVLEVEMLLKFHPWLKFHFSHVILASAGVMCSAVWLSDSC